MNKVRLHDEFFKYVFSRPEEMRDFITHSFPHEIVKNLNLNTLTKIETAYVTEDLKKYFSDLVYTCDYKNKIKIKIALLFEHKSSPVMFPHFQLMDYINEIWKEGKGTKKRKMLVIPIVFYHGQKAWNAKNITDYFGEIDENLKRFIPNFDYILIDTSKINDEDIEKYKSVFLQISIFLLKNVFDSDEISRRVEHFFIKVNNNNFNFNDITTFIEYLENN